MKMIKSIALATMIIGISACRDYNAKVADSTAVAGNVAFNMEEKMAAVVDEHQPAAKTVDEITERKLIKNGDISFETTSITETRSFLQKRIAAGKGYISNERIESYRTNPTEVLTIRIPGNRFDTLIADIGRQVGTFDSKRIDINDVTAEFVDMEARLKNKRQLEEKYRELLKKADNMEDILNIEAQISVIREEIESTEGRLLYLESQVGYSTLTITYYEESPTAGFNFGEKMGDAFSNGGTGVLWFMIGMVQLWPLWIAGLALWYMIRSLIRLKRRKAQPGKAIL